MIDEPLQDLERPEPSSPSDLPPTGDLNAVIDLRELLDLAVEGILVLSEDQRILYFNRSAARIFGYEPAEVLGRRLDLLIPERFVEVHQAHIRQFAAESEPSREMASRRLVQGRHKDGHEILLEVSISRQSRAGIVTFAAVLHDLSERVRTLQLLEQRVEERTRELERRRQVAEDLHEVLAILNSNRPLSDILAHILARAGEVLNADAGAIYQLALDGRSFTVQEARDLPDATHLSPALEPLCERLAARQPIFIPDLAARPEAMPAGWRYPGLLAIPLLIHDELYGVVALCFQAARELPDELLALGVMFANQAALAIENASLHAQVQAAAALHERQRLGRDLHDSVSQMIYGMALSIRTARRLLDRDPAQAAQPLDHSLALAEAALTEMRALIFELRPESLELEGLVVAIGKHVAFLQARHGLDINLFLGDEPPVPLPVKEALYRVTQEALQNVLRHARASQVSVRLANDDRGLVWEVRDDGQGFDPSGNFPGHVGLRSMRERVEQVGGVWEIESAPGQGVRLRARIPA